MEWNLFQVFAGTSLSRFALEMMWQRILIFLSRDLRTNFCSLWFRWKTCREDSDRHQFPCSLSDYCHIDDSWNRSNYCSVSPEKLFWKASSCSNSDTIGNDCNNLRGEKIMCERELNVQSSGFKLALYQTQLLSTSRGCKSGQPGCIFPLLGKKSIWPTRYGVPT